jgi:hypothetical protein
LRSIGAQADAGQEFSVRAAVPRENSAAAFLLGASLGAVREGTQAFWRKRAEERWRAFHSKAGALQVRLGGIEEVTSKKAADADALWDKAQVVSQLEGDPAATALLQQILAVNPRHVPANFALGRILLQSGDAKGESLLETAMSEDEQLLPKAVPFLHSYFQRRGSADRIRDLYARLDQFEKSVQASHTERQNVSAADEFLPHELEPEQLAALCRLLQSWDDIDSAMLGRKQLTHFVKQRLFVLCVRVRTGWHRIPNAKLERAIVANLFKAVHLPGRVLIFAPSGSYRGIAYKLAKIPGANLILSRPLAVAQTSKSAVSPISKSARRAKSSPERAWKPAAQQTWKSALQKQICAPPSQPLSFSLCFWRRSDITASVKQSMLPKKVMRRTGLFTFCRVLSLGLALFSAALTARAALQFDVFLGYDDILPERSWFPVACELHNDGASFNAVIEITAEGFGDAQTRRFALDLPANTRKRVFIPVFGTAREWTVRLYDDRGKMRGEQTLRTAKVIKSGLPLVASLSRTVAGSPVFPDPAVPAMGLDSRFAAARLQPALFPDNPLALDGIAMLYLSSERAANLSVGQVNALLAWLQDGGHLVLGVEQLTDVNATPWLRELLPCQLTTTASVNQHDALQDWSAQRVPSPIRPINVPSRRGPGPNFRTNAVGAPRPVPAIPPQGPIRVAPPQAPVFAASDPEDDAQFATAPLQAAAGSLRDGEVLIGTEAAPLAIDASRGRGKITVLLFSPEREPFVSWKGRTWFWARLAGVPAGTFQQGQSSVMPSGRMSSDGIFGAMIDSKQVRKLPLGWLLALLVAYLAVIGPLDQYWLKKINRQMLTWITFPCYVLIFSGLIYYIGAYLRAGELEWNELSMVDILPDNDRAVLRGQTYVSIYSPINARYKMAGSQRFASLRGEFGGNLNGNQETSRAVVTQTGDSFEAEAVVPVWTSHLFVSDWVQPAALPLEMTASRQGTTWQVTVQNHLDRALAPVHAVLGGRIYDLGALGAGQTKTLSLEAGQGTAVGDLARQFSDPFRNAVNSRNSSFGHNVNVLPDLAAGSMAASFISTVNDVGSPNGGPVGWNSFAIPSGLDLSRYADNSHGILLAWDADHGLGGALNRFDPKRLHRSSLLRLVIPMKL